MTEQINEVFHLEAEELVHCYYCQKQQNQATYPRGEAFLAGPDHSPRNGHANYICKRHLDPDAVIDGLVSDGRNN